MESSSVQQILGIFAKAPRPGEVKTRLAQETSPRWAAEVARACLEDTLQRLAGMPARRTLVYTPASAREFFAKLVGDRFDLRPQADGDLGLRMEAFLRETVANNNGHAVLMGADSPTMPVDFVLQAFKLLAANDVVLGPALDGGYYLLGCARGLPPIFAGIDWGGPKVLLETIRRLEDASWRVALLPPWYDVDTLADWRMLCGHIEAMRRAGVDPRTPALARLIETGP